MLKLKKEDLQIIKECVINIFIGTFNLMILATGVLLLVVGFGALLLSMFGVINLLSTGTPGYVILMLIFSLMGNGATLIMFSIFIKKYYKLED